MTDGSRGLQEALGYPFFSALFNRRSRRISRGIGSVPAGSLSYTSSRPPQPLTPLEEAVLIAVTGITGITLPDMPYETADGEKLAGTPMLEVTGRSASSPDNAQATHFFLINDTGTYLLREPEDPDPDRWRDGVTPESLIAAAESCKVRVLDHRLDFPREYPCYIGRNRYVSNLPGSTILVPVVDLTRQYINGLMFVLSHHDGPRPTPIDDWNFYRMAGVKKWVKSGFLDKNLKLPLGFMGTFRIHVEAELLIQNILLTIQALGLGGWVHAAFPGPILLGDPDPDYARYGKGLGFRYEKPRTGILRRLLKPVTPLPAWRANPVGLDGLLEGYCPPYYPSMSAAVDALVEHKYGKSGVYSETSELKQAFQPGKGEVFLEEVPHYPPEVVECTRDICNYIYDTYGRFPAHVDAMFVPGIWVQAHHLDLDYYDALYEHGYSSTQARHDELWHEREESE
jgi:hypothetical protein